MSHNYIVSVNQTHDFELTSEDVSKLDSISDSHSKFHVLHQNKSYKAELIESDFLKKSYKVKINNNTYNINIANPLDIIIKELGFEVGATKQINDIKAPMPGLILEINVKIGQEVKENDPLLILEAMKMENVILSPKSGIIKSIAVEKGNAVDKSQLLIEFEQ